MLDNIALVVLEEMSPGSEAWLTWRDILNLFDIICCCLVLFPIVWQIRSLRIAAATDGTIAFYDKRDENATISDAHTTHDDGVTIINRIIEYFIYYINCCCKG